MKWDGRDCVCASKFFKIADFQIGRRLVFLLFPPSFTQMKSTKGQQDIVQITLFSELNFFILFRQFSLHQTTSGCHSVPLLARYVSGPCEALVHKLHFKGPDRGRTFRFAIRWFLILRENHSREVEPVLNLFSGAFSTASAIIELWSVNA